MAVPDLHSTTALLEIERLTSALSAAWLAPYGVLPLRLDGAVLTIGTWLAGIEPLVRDALRLLVGAGICIARFTEHDRRSAIGRVYAPEAATAEGMIAGMANEARTGDIEEIPLDALLHLANEAPVVRLV